MNYSNKLPFGQGECGFCFFPQLHCFPCFWGR